MKDTLTRLSTARGARILVGLFIGLTASFLARAQAPATGTIQGRVYNPASQEYVRNAEVRLDGTANVTFTENDGSFSFTGVPAGPASVTVTYTGYNTVKEAFTVVGGQTAVREINLTSTAAARSGKEGVVRLEAFTVSSDREGNAKAIQAQRR